MPEDYACATAVLTAHDEGDPRIGAEPGYSDCEYAIEPEPGGYAHREGIEELADASRNLPDYRAGARIIVRDVTYGPWRYVTAEQISVEVTADD
jgi:hypothetical protein